MAALRIGTRDSRLAIWQADLVKGRLEQAGHASELVPVKSEGDIDLSTPLYEMGVQGIFTRSLDSALLAGRVDLAVHSLKDVPTRLAEGISICAVLERADHTDLLILREGVDPHSENFVLGSSSIRRRAQWSRRYPSHTLENLRGNVDTRMRKLKEGNYDGIIMAAAGLERSGMRPADAIVLDWMLPAPAQGAIVVVCRSDDEKVFNAIKPLNHAQTSLCTGIERDLLRRLQGGCSSPIGAYASIEDGHVRLKGNVLSVDGKDMMEIELAEELGIDNSSLGYRAADQLLQEGAGAIIGPKHQSS